MTDKASHGLFAGWVQVLPWLQESAKKFSKLAFFFLTVSRHWVTFQRCRRSYLRSVFWAPVRCAQSLPSLRWMNLRKVWNFLVYLKISLPQKSVQMFASRNGNRRKLFWHIWVDFIVFAENSDVLKWSASIKYGKRNYSLNFIPH